MIRLVACTASIWSAYPTKPSGARSREASQGIFALRIPSFPESLRLGFLFDEVSGFLDEASSFPHLKIRGLMAVLPVDHGKKKESEAFFDKMFQLFVDMKTKKADNINMGILSMGMSNDYELAVAHGANLVRVGSEIFGPRNYI